MNNPAVFLITELKKNLANPGRLPAPLSWRMLLPGDAVSVQRMILREYLMSGSPLARGISLALAVLFWPWNSTVQAVRLIRANGEECSAFRPRWRQLLQQLYLAWIHGISPSMYYQMGIVRSRQSYSPMAWIQAGHAGLLSRIFRADKRLEEINDKRLFDSVLEKGAVPRLKTIAEVSMEVLERSDSLAALISRLESQQELFLKPVRGRGGRGAMVLLRCPDGWRGFRSTPDTSNPIFTLGTNELAIQLAESAQNGAWLLQARARNHPVIETIFGEALACIRVVSGIRGDDVVLLGSVVGVGSSHSIVSQSGLTIEVDIETGRLGQGFHSTESQRFMIRNPDNDEMIEGVELPDWKLLKETVTAAHRQFADYPFVGWDMALTTTGPVVVEANGNFGTGAMQKPGPRPMIDESFLSVFDYWKRNAGVSA